MTDIIRLNGIEYQITDWSGLDFKCAVNSHNSDKMMICVKKKAMPSFDEFTLQYKDTLYALVEYVKILEQRMTEAEKQIERLKNG